LGGARALRRLYRIVLGIGSSADEWMMYRF
jgi:hypothetical protein